MTSMTKRPCDEGVIRSTEAESPCAPKARPWVLAATILGTSMAFIDETAVTHQLEAEKIKLGGAEVPDSIDAALGTTVEQAIDEAFVSGYRVVMLVATALALASVLSAALLIEGKKKRARRASAESVASAASTPLDAESPAYETAGGRRCSFQLIQPNRFAMRDQGSTGERGTLCGVGSRLPPRPHRPARPNRCCSSSTTKLKLAVK